MLRSFIRRLSTSLSNAEVNRLPRPLTRKFMPWEARSTRSALLSSAVIILTCATSIPSLYEYTHARNAIAYNLEGLQKRLAVEGLVEAGLVEDSNMRDQAERVEIQKYAVDSKWQLCFFSRSTWFRLLFYEMEISIIFKYHGPLREQITTTTTASNTSAAKTGNGEFFVMGHTTGQKNGYFNAISLFTREDKSRGWVQLHRNDALLSQYLGFSLYTFE